MSLSQIEPMGTAARLAAIALFVALGACSRSKGAASPEPCRDDVGDDVNNAGHVGVEGVKTGAKTAAEGVKTFGSATAGLVSGGGDEAKARWNEGKAETSRTANAGADDTRRQNRPKCH